MHKWSPRRILGVLLLSSISNSYPSVSSESNERTIATQAILPRRLASGWNSWTFKTHCALLIAQWLYELPIQQGRVWEAPGRNKIELVKQFPWREPQMALGIMSSIYNIGLIINLVVDFIKIIVMINWYTFSIFRCLEESERSYAQGIFEILVWFFGIVDHTPPSFELLLEIYEKIKRWLDVSKRNAIVIHCKAGKVHVHNCCSKFFFKFITSFFMVLIGPNWNRLLLFHSI